MALPTISRMAGTIPRNFREPGARYIFGNCSQELGNDSARQLSRFFPENTPVELVDDFYHRIRANEDHLYYLISIRCGLLSFRVGELIILESYSPHRCAHQFGLDQETPAWLSRPHNLSPNQKALRKCWSYLFEKRVLGLAFPSCQNHVMPPSLASIWIGILVGPPQYNCTSQRS